MCPRAGHRGFCQLLRVSPSSFSLRPRRGDLTLTTAMAKPRADQQARRRRVDLGMRIQSVVPGEELIHTKDWDFICDVRSPGRCRAGR